MKNYSRWSNKNELMSKIDKISIGSKITTSGLVLNQDSNNYYIDSCDAATLVIGGTGSGKTQCITLPLIKTSLLAGDNVIVNDIRGDIYKETSEDLKKNGYDVKVLNLKDITNSNSFNPLYLPAYLYHNENKDKALELIYNLSYYILPNDDGESFWVNSARDYFVGLCLYLIKNFKIDDVNLLELYLLEQKEEELREYIKKYPTENTSIYLNNILNVPQETRGGIIATFKQKYNKFITKEEFSKVILSNEFDLEKLSLQKTIYYIISGMDELSKSLVPLFINQVNLAVTIFGNNKNRLNIILDDVSRYERIVDLENLINYSRGYNIKYTFLIRGYQEFINNYGKEQFSLIKQSCNIIYLLSNDLETIKDISVLCGNSSENIPLISIEELKVLKNFEAIYLKSRLYPIRLTLIPNYKIKWK